VIVFNWAEGDSAGGTGTTVTAARPAAAGAGQTGAGAEPSSAVIPALPTLQRSLHASETGVTWLLTGFLLSASVGTAIIGKLGDMYGKERLLVWTLVVLAAGTLLAAVSGPLPELIAARVIQGVAGGIFPLSFGIVRDEFPADRVSGSIGLMSAILGIGGGFGLLIGGLIDEHLTWHWLFWIPLAAMIAAAVCTWRLIPESQVRATGGVNWAAAALLTTGMSVVLFAIAQTTTWGWGSPRALALLAGGLAVCAAWIRVELRSRQPLVDMTMMRVRGVWTVNLAAFLLGGGLYTFFLVLPQFAQLPVSTGFGYGASVVVAGLYLLPSALVMGVLGTVAGRVGRRFTSRRALITGAVVSGMNTAAHAGRGGRRPDRRHLHRGQHGARPAAAVRLHRDLRDGGPVPGRLRGGRRAHPGPGGGRDGAGARDPGVAPPRALRLALPGSRGLATFTGECPGS
jgi:MFS family permease